MFGLGKRRRQVVEHHGEPPVEDQLRQALRERDAAVRHRDDAEAYARDAADRLNETRREAGVARAERDEATRELRAAGYQRHNFFEALFATAPGVKSMEGTPEQVALWYVRDLRRQLAEASAELVKATEFELALARHMPESWDDDAAFTSIADDFVRTVAERLIALGGSLDRYPEALTVGDRVRQDNEAGEGAPVWPQDRAKDITYGGSSKVAATFHPGEPILTSQHPGPACIYPALSNTCMVCGVVREGDAS